jgi:hypothetical protein
MVSRQDVPGFHGAGMRRVGATWREAAPDGPPREDEQPADVHPLGDQEIVVLAWFSASSMQDPEVRARLWSAWGMCPRHSLGFVAVEASIYRGWLFAPAMLYEDLMERAAGALEPRRINGRRRMIAALQASEPCLLCADGLTAAAPAPATAASLVEVARDLAPLRGLASMLRPRWQRWVCGRCSGSGGPLRCRPHLIADLTARSAVDLSAQRAAVQELVRHLHAYARSFGWATRGTESDADRAALLGAVGWCGGWELILRYLT